MREAHDAMRRGDLRRAEGLLDQVVKANPKNLHALVGLGVIAVNTGRQAIAIQRFNRALEIDRNCPPALLWMSILALQAGSFEQATRFAEEAIKLEPGNVQTQGVLARCYLQQDRFQEALEVADALLTKDPNDAPMLYVGASALQNLGFINQAAELFRRATALQPELQGLITLAELELELSRQQEAIQAAKKAIELDPARPQARVALAKALTQAGRLEEAGPEWDQAIDLGADPDNTRYQRAWSFSGIGRNDLALDLYQESIRENPAKGIAYFSIAASRKVTEADRPLIEAMEKQIADPGLDPVDRRHFEYALGKAANDLENYQEAMAHYDGANRLNWELYMKDNPFDPEAYCAFVERQTQIPQTWTGNHSELPIFVVGMMRSGTTLAEQILTCHPQIGGAGEMGFWSEQESRLTDPQRLKVAADRYLSHLQSVRPGSARIVDKNPANVLLANLIHRAFPNARIIHMRRHPVDTALSIWMTPMATTASFVSDKENIVFAYRLYEQSVAHTRQFVPEDRFLEVDYENMTADPETWVRRIVEFCGLEWDPACLHPELNPKLVRTPSMWQVRQPINVNSTGRWKRYEPWLGPLAKLLEP